MFFFVFLDDFNVSISKKKNKIKIILIYFQLKYTLHHISKHVFNF